MASITFDGQSFLLDGRRVWLVSGSIPYARVPRAHWAERILAAKHAGLNCIETPIVWARHEPRQGQFDFTGENDIREFVRLVHAAGLFCIIRPGPLVDQGFDLGGLPPWLTTADNIKLRASNQPFLEACSRYITAVAGQLRDLQVNAPTPKGSPAGTTAGPIILLQNENGYTCGDDHLAATYLGELDRYYRESGFTVPIINANDLWQSVEGEIDGWTGYDDLLSHLRQLGTIRPAQPRIVIDFRVGARSAWATPAQAQKAPSSVMRRIAEVLAAGGQF
ncbi:MAG: beta-galactosidase, partial [Phycisphaerales bacterium]|nr:beta-galactosidase [Phycisphaerales bacterium]